MYFPAHAQSVITSNDGKFINKWSINTPTGAIDNIDIDVNSKGIIYLADRAADQVLVISP
jgi:hypothetical protein